MPSHLTCDTVQPAAFITNPAAITRLKLIMENVINKIFPPIADLEGAKRTHKF